MMMMPVATADTHSPPAKPPSALGGPVKRDALLESIRGGISLKVNARQYCVLDLTIYTIFYCLIFTQKVDTNAAQAASSSGPMNLLQEIRQGKELRPAAERELNASAPRNSGDGVVNMALALRHALEERQRAIGPSSDESEGDSSDNDWDA